MLSGDRLPIIFTLLLLNVIVFFVGICKFLFNCVYGIVFYLTRRGILISVLLMNLPLDFGRGLVDLPVCVVMAVQPLQEHVQHWDVLERVAGRGSPRWLPFLSIDVESPFVKFVVATPGALKERKAKQKLVSNSTITEGIHD